MQKLIRPSTWILAAVFAIFSAALLYAAPQMAGDKMASEQTVTGCLQKGGEPVGYFIVGADGTHWELYPSDKVSLGDHVGHTVAVTGSILKRSAAQEEKSQPYEKKEMTGGAHHDLKVTGMKMVSENCNK